MIMARILMQESGGGRSAKELIEKQDILKCSGILFKSSE